MTTRMLSLREVADRCGVSPAVILTQIRKGQLRAMKIGGSWRIEPVDFQAYLDTSRAAAHLPTVASGVMHASDADTALPSVPRRFS